MKVAPRSLPQKSCFFSLFLLTSGFSFSAAVRNTKDGIEISVESKLENGKTLITSVLSNHSSHTIATFNQVTPSSAFYFKLVDLSGHEIPQMKKWSESFGQK